jgi:hypothetical protein
LGEKYNDTGQLNEAKAGAGIGTIVEEYKMSGRKEPAVADGITRDPEAA